MDNYVDSGSTVNYTNASGSTIAAGSIVAAGHCLGVAIADIADGETGALQVKGKVTAPKVSAAVFAVGEKLVWDASAGAFDDSAAVPASGDLTGAAVAAVAGADTETTCTVVLTPGNATLTA
jgi:predicted RecA/RadA family phage recombinase